MNSIENQVHIIIETHLKVVIIDVNLETVLRKKDILFLQITVRIKITDLYYQYLLMKILKTLQIRQ